MPAPTGNLYWMNRERHGRAKDWQSVEEMQDAITDYFDKCKAYTVMMPVGFDIKPVNKPRIPTIEGLARVLGMNRSTLLKYENEEGYEDFSNTIKRAKSYIQELKAESLINGDGSTTGLIFDMKNNHGYLDKTQQDVRVSVKGKPAWLGATATGKANEPTSES